MKTISTKNRLKAWLQLVRIPNLLTVPGDPLAGFLLAGGHDIVLAVPCLVASLLIYMAGLLWNDYADADEDMRARPGRPIPSGAVSRRAAFVVAVLLALGGLCSALLAGPLSLMVAFVLALLVLGYDFLTKNTPAGRWTMGLCRGVSLVLGASADGREAIISIPVILAAACLVFYISAISAVAMRETEKTRLGSKRWLPLFCLGVSFVLFFQIICIEALAPVIIAEIALFWVWWWSAKLRGEPEPRLVSSAIGAFLKGLLLVQAVFCAMVPGIGVLSAAVLLLLWPVVTLLGRHFRAS